MVYILKVEIHGGYVVVVHSVLDVLQVVVGHWHAQLEELLVHSLLWVLELVPQLIILGVKLLSKSHFSHFVVDLGKLLHLEVVLSDQMLLLLCEVSQVPCWGPSIDLA